MKIILGSHWRECPEGWTVFSEQQQDMLKPLNFLNDTVDVIFSEHAAMEHLPFVGGIGFLTEAYRVLKSGGIIRVCCPFIDRLTKFQDYGPLTQNYAKNSLKWLYPLEDMALHDLGIPFVENALPFIFDSLTKKHGHQFLWSTTLLEKVLLKIGFREVNVTVPGSSRWDLGICQERVIRGLDEETIDKYDVRAWDPESLVVEAMK